MLDSIFSIYIKAIHGWRCAYCNAKFHPPAELVSTYDPYLGNPEFLDCSHFFNRRHQATRTDEDNCDPLCRKCHTVLERLKSEGQEYHRFKFERLGKKQFILLRQRANSIVKISDQDRLELAEHYLKKLKLMGYNVEPLERKYFRENINV